MEAEQISILIPALFLLFLGMIEALGGLYFNNDRRTKNDYAIEILGLVTLPTLIQPAILLTVLFRRLFCKFFFVVACCGIFSVR
jgi:hypothetical protein